MIQFSFVITIDTTSLRAAYQLLFPLPIHNRHTLNCMLETQRLYQIPRRCLDLDSCLQLSHQAPIHLRLLSACLCLENSVLPKLMATKHVSLPQFGTPIAKKEETSESECADSDGAYWVDLEPQAEGIRKIVSGSAHSKGRWMGAWWLSCKQLSKSRQRRGIW